MDRPDQRLTIFASLWLAQGGLMSLSALGSLGVSLFFVVMNGVAGAQRPFPSGIPAWLSLYPVGAAVQLGIGIHALLGVVAAFRRRPGAVGRLRSASVYLLVFLAATTVVVLAALLVFLGARHAITIIAAGVMVASGVFVALLPLTTLKWLRPEAHR